MKDGYSGNWHKDSSKFQESMTSWMKARTWREDILCSTHKCVRYRIAVFQICANTDRLLFKQLRAGCTRANAFCLLSFAGRNLPVMTEDGLLPNLMNNPRFHSLASRYSSHLSLNVSKCYLGRFIIWFYIIVTNNVYVLIIRRSCANIVSPFMDK